MLAIQSLRLPRSSEAPIFLLDDVIMVERVLVVYNPQRHVTRIGNRLRLSFA